VCCLYCGKEIGAFRLLRDSEFCSVAHRRKYGERLGKALHNIAEPEPAPAGIAGFLVRMPFQQGNTVSVKSPWKTDQRLTGIRTGTKWTLSVDTTEAPEDDTPVVESAPLQCPPKVERWMASPAAEPVAAFVKASAATIPAYTLQACRFSGVLTPTSAIDQAAHALAASGSWMPAPGPEVVATFVRPSTALAHVATLHIPHLSPELGVYDRSHAPVACDQWMPAPGAEPVSAWVQPAAALAPATMLRLPRLEAEFEATPFLDLGLDRPPMCESWIPSPAPEPVALLVQPSVALAPAHAQRLPHFAAELEPASIPDLAVFAHGAAPEPVAAFVQSITALEPANFLPTIRLGLAMESSGRLDARPASCTLWMTDQTAAVACAPTLDAPTPEYARTADPGTTLQMPAAEFTAELDPLPTEDELFEPPEMCQQWMPVPAADPVFSYLAASSAPALALPVSLQLPVFGASVAFPHVPCVTWPRSIPDPEPVLAPILPTTVNTALVLLPSHATIMLPAATQAEQALFAAALPTAPAAAPEAVESLLVAAEAALPLSIRRGPSSSAELDAPPPVVEAAPAIAKAVAGLAPAPLESLLVASVAAAIAPVIDVRMLPFAMAVGQESTVPSFNAIQLAPSVRKSRGMASRLRAVEPIGTVALTPPANVRRPLESALPQPGVIPVEFHTHSLRSGPVARPEWKVGRPTLVAPKFNLRPVPEKLEDPNAQKPVRKEPEVVKILNMPAAKRPPTVLMVFGRVAAGFLLVVSLWYGLINMRGGRQLALREVSSSSPALSASTAGSRASVRPAPRGAMARVRQVIANRAALKVDENFHGMENWDTEGKANTTGWSRHPDGYMNTGALALFRPTLKFNDYRMEFFGQIESKSIGWTVRSTDPKNYHAMKLTVVEAGLRPFVALVHYNVVNGKSGHRTQTPLNVMVHNNRPLQFAVDVRGNRFVTSINGEEVDSFIDNTLTAGGVGFFSEAGERARLYWMKFTRNDDWLGHVCALLAQEAGVGQVADLRTPGLPGSAPVPGTPSDSYGATLSAAWIGLPYLRAPRKTRFFNTWRSEPWNT
jgi:hypothetical protein